MVKKKTLKKLKESKKIYLTKHIPFTNSDLKDPKTTAKVLVECFREGDIESFRDVLIAHLMTVNKTKVAKEMGLSRRTLHKLIDVKQKFNPEFITLIDIMKALNKS